jgi:general secretion pathway protein A
MKEQNVFPALLIEEIYVRTQGIPRLINLVCENLLLTAFAMECKVATLEMLDEVTGDLRLEWPVKKLIGQTLQPAQS